MKWSNFATIGCAAAALGLLAFVMPSQAGQPWKAEDVERDFVGECFTTAVGVNNAAAPGGLSCYGTSLFISGRSNVLRVTVSTTGDTHNGAALRLGCRIRPGLTGVWSFCNPTGTGAAPGDYITKNKLPTNLDAAGVENFNNCFDGGGGSADCHDNSIEQTWCVDIIGDDTFDIDVRIASNPGGASNFVFIEASTFYVDGVKLAGGCGGINASATTPF